MANDRWNNFEREETDTSGLIRGERASFKAAGAEYVTDSGELLGEGDEFVVLTLIEVCQSTLKARDRSISTPRPETRVLSADRSAIWIKRSGSWGWAPSARILGKTRAICTCTSA
jgi:hypothetical protein